MPFAKKLDFLMNITKTSNSALARFVSLDASYISRMRTGKRLIPKDTSVINNMAACFSRRCVEEYQKKAVCDALKLANFNDDTKQLTEEIARWLINVQEPLDSLEKFLDSFSKIKERPILERRPAYKDAVWPQDKISVHYGIEGKRKAVEYFLSEVAAQKYPQTLLLFSDEGTSWMTEDPAFSRRWAELMFLVLAQGNKIKIVHTISRDLDEMLRAISQWMPLYMVGSIEPFFYPKKRDGVFRRTLFIAPGTAAVVSNSIGDQINTASNILYRDKDAVSSFEQEFMQYLRLCRPLMRIFKASDYYAYFKTLAEFEREQANTLVRTESLSLMTMPQKLKTSVFKRSCIDSMISGEMQKTRHEMFLENLERNYFTEIISLPDIPDVKNGRIKVSTSDMMKGGAIYYTPSEFYEHLENVISLLNSRENYYVYLTNRPMDNEYTVYVREDIGVIVAKTSQPPVVLAMSESNMTAAFWDFLTNVMREKTYAAPDKDAAIRELSAYLKKLKSEL